LLIVLWIDIFSSRNTQQSKINNQIASAVLVKKTNKVGTGVTLS